MRNMESVILSHDKQILIPENNILDEISELEMNVFWTINVLYPIFCIKQRSLM